MRERLVLLTLALVTTVTAVVSSLGAPLVPEIARVYDVPVATAQWALTATVLAGAVTTPLLGRWASGRVRRPVMIGAIALVLAGAVLSALPLGFGPLIAGRAVQGLGLALVPLALATARDTWRGEAQVRTLGLLSVTTVAGAGLGYPVTALVAEHLGLHGAYWFGAVLLAATLAMCVAFLPRADDAAPQPVDLPGAVLLGAGVLAVLLAVSQGEHWGWTTPRVLVLAIGGAVLVLAWVPLTLRRRHPLVDLRLARRPGVVGPNLVALLVGGAMYGLLTLAVVVVQADGTAPGGFGLGLGVAAAGLVLVPYSVMSVGGNQLARRVAGRLGQRVLLPVGCTLFASCLATLALWHDHLWQVLLAMAIGGLGSGFTFSSLAALIVPFVPRAETGSAMAFNQLLRYLGFSVGSASSVALLAVLGGDDHALVVTLAVLAGLCLVAALADPLTRRSARPSTGLAGSA